MKKKWKIENSAFISRMLLEFQNAIMKTEMYLEE